MNIKDFEKIEILDGFSGEIDSNSPEDTFALGEKLGSIVKKGDIICLNGDLGVGKTVFTKGLAKGLGVDDMVNSPTFTIVKEYMGRLPLYHFDVYRISDSSEMDEIGYEDYFFGDGVCIIEWPDIIWDIIPEYATYISIDKDLDISLDYRKISIRKVSGKGKIC